MLTNRK